MPPPLLIFLIIFFFFFPCPSSQLSDPSLNITLLLSHLPSFSLLNKLLSSTGVADEINSRSSLTLLSPNDTALSALLSGFDGGGIPTQQMADTLRYQVLLEYMDLPEMEQRAALGDQRQRLVTTLYQTTGRAEGVSGWISLQSLPGGAVGVGSGGGAPPAATVLPDPLRLFPYNLSVLQIDRVLVPPLLAQAPPPPAAPPVDIVAALSRAGRFSTFLAFLSATGVDATFTECESKEGITIFAPVDEAFAAIPAASSLQKLTAQQKILVLEYHALNTYYALGTLSEFRNPAAPTVATSDPRSGGAGQFTVNITSVGGIFTLDTGVVSAPVVATLLEHQPVSIFIIEKVLLPNSLFGSGSEAPAPSLPSAFPTPPPPPPPPPLFPSQPPPAFPPPPVSPNLASSLPPKSGPPPSLSPIASSSSPFRLHRVTLLLFLLSFSLSTGQI